MVQVDTYCHICELMCGLKATDGIPERGGRVVVIDPRHTETAKRHEHILIKAGTDAYLLQRTGLVASGKWGIPGAIG